MGNFELFSFQFNAWSDIWYILRLFCQSWYVQGSNLGNLGFYFGSKWLHLGRLRLQFKGTLQRGSCLHLILAGNLHLMHESYLENRPNSKRNYPIFSNSETRNSHFVLCRWSDFFGSETAMTQSKSDIPISLPGLVNSALNCSLPNIIFGWLMTPIVRQFH